MIWALLTAPAGRERACFGIAQSQSEPHVSFEVLQLAHT